jgi:hypothetical protein
LLGRQPARPAGQAGQCLKRRWAPSC